MMMNRLAGTRCLLSFSCAAFALALALPPRAGGADANALFANPGLEELDEAGTWPAGWPKGGEAVTFHEEDGNRFLRITSGGVETMDMLYLRAAVPGDARTLALTVRVRHADVRSGRENWNDARIIVNALDDTGKKTDLGGPRFLGTSGGWVQSATRLALPAGTVAVEMIPCLFHAESGTMDIDDVSLAVVGVRRQAAPPLEEADTPVVRGNAIETLDGRPLLLRGLNIPSLEWNVRGERVLESAQVAVDDWRANLIRLAVSPLFWFGRGGEQNDWNAQDDGGEAYRALVDDVVAYANRRGCYVLLDLHVYRSPTEEHAAFWRDAAKRYANRPGVLFDLMNEPHDTSWKIWRDGGVYTEDGKDADPAGKTAAGAVLHRSIGMQALVDAVRESGAKNIVVCGGLDWAYDLTGVMNGYGLRDPDGNGIVYSAHIYPWKSGWDEKVLVAAKAHPVLVGEVGCQEQPMPWEAVAQNPYKWAPDILAYLGKHRLHWAAWSFHPSASPCVVSDWDYHPTPAWGAFVRAALEGAVFQSDRTR
jgi:endoglucanase